MNWQIIWFSVGSIETYNSSEMDFFFFFDYCCDINENDLCQNHHVIKRAKILPLNKLSSKEIYSILISNILNKPTSNIYFEKLFENTILYWIKIYRSPRLLTIDTTFISFQYKILNNVLFLNKKLYTFGITNTALCSFCNSLEETFIRILFDCVMLNVFGKDYGWNFRAILSCRHLDRRLVFVDCIMKQMTIIIFWFIFYWFFNIIFTYQAKNEH